MKIIMVTGVAGVGKSTITKAIQKEIEANVVDYADFMLEAMKTKNKDSIKELPLKERLEVYQKAEKYMEEYFNNLERGLLILENHITVINGKNEIVRFPPEGFKVYRMNAIINIIGNAEDIRLRRIDDKTRKRRIDNEKLISDQQNANIEEIEKIKSIFNISTLSYQNNNDSFDLLHICNWIKNV